MFPLIRINLNHRNHMIIATSTFSKRSVSKTFCSLRATSLGGGGTEGGENTLYFSPPPPPPRAISPETACSLRPFWSAKSTILNDLFIFKTVRLKKLHKYAGIHHWSSQKGVYLAWTLYLAWSGVPPPSPAVYNLLLTREEGTICSWNHRCERDWCLQIAIRKDWFQIERIPGQKETGLCTYGTQAPTGYHCPLLWL